MYVSLNAGACVAWIKINLGTPGCKHDYEQRVLYPSAKSARSEKLCRLSRFGFRRHDAKLTCKTPYGRVLFFCFSILFLETYLLNRDLIFSRIGPQQSSHRSIHCFSLLPTKMAILRQLPHFPSTELRTNRNSLSDVAYNAITIQSGAWSVQTRCIYVTLTIFCQMLQQTKVMQGND